MTLQTRIHQLLAGGHTRADLAKAAGVTAAAVTHWLNVETKTIKSGPAAGLQALTGYNAVWIATGKGPERVGSPVVADQSIDGVLKLLCGFLADADAEDRDALQGLFATLIRKPGDDRVLGSIKLMLEPKAFAQSQKKSA